MVHWPWRKKGTVDEREKPPPQPQKDVHQQVLDLTAKSRQKKQEEEAKERQDQKAAEQPPIIMTKSLVVRLEYRIGWSELWAEMRRRSGNKMDETPPAGLLRIIRNEPKIRPGRYDFIAHNFPEAGVTRTAFRAIRGEQMLREVRSFGLYLAVVLQNYVSCSEERVFDPDLVWIDTIRTDGEEEMGKILPNENFPWMQDHLQDEADNGDYTGFLMCNGLHNRIGELGEWFFLLELLRPNRYDHTWGQRDWLLSLKLES